MKIVASSVIRFRNPKLIGIMILIRVGGKPPEGFLTCWTKIVPALYILCQNSVKVDLSCNPSGINKYQSRLTVRDVHLPIKMLALVPQEIRKVFYSSYKTGGQSIRSTSLHNWYLTKETVRIKVKVEPGGI